MAVFSLEDAETRLSWLVEQAARGEEIIIAENGIPRVKLIAVPPIEQGRQPARSMKITYIADDFDAHDERVAALFAS